jgi:hypothetical protein
MSFDLRRAIRNRIAFLRGMGSGLVSIAQGFEKYQSRLREMQAEMEASIKRAEEDESDLLFQTVGQALTTWAHLEVALVAIFALLMRTGGERSGLILYSIVNFNTWLSIIHDLFEMDHDLRQFQKRWNKISERIRRVKDQRDQIAHHAVRVERPALIASDWDVRRKTLQQKPITVREAIDFSKTVSAIAQDALILANEMGNALVALKEKSAEQDSNR